jgi:hypothetical protein
LPSPLLDPIHRSAWKVNSANFALTAFSKKFALGSSEWHHDHVGER